MASIRKRGEYQWFAQIRRHGYPPRSKTFETRADAEKWARAIERELDQGLFINRAPAEKTTLGGLLDTYLKEVVPSHKGAEVEKIRIKSIQRASIGRLALIALTPQALANWRDERLMDVSAATVRRELDIISSAINTARKDWGIHMDNPVMAMRRPAPSKARDRRLHGDEEALLLSVLEANDDRRNKWIGPFFRFALESAMRRGEILALEWKHVDLEARTAHLPDTKNGTARTVPLSSRAITVLRGLLQEEEGVKTLPTGNVFPITADAVKKAWQRALRTTRKEYEEECELNGKKPVEGFIVGLRVHDLRHEATSRIAEKLDNILELSAVTGHKDVRMLKRYYHPRAEDLAKKLG